MQDLVKEIKQDPNFGKFTRIFERVQQRVKLEAATKEALSLHGARTSRDLNGEDRYSPKKLVDANLRDLSSRARLVEIRVRNELQIAVLREAVDAMRRHIATEYADELRELGTVEQRKALANRVLKKALEFLAEGEALVAMIDTLIKDIDQCNFSMRNTIECLKLLMDSKGSKVV